MKKTILTTFLLIALAITTTNNAQVVIGVSTTNVHPSAQLDVTSTTKGFLPPRMTITQRDEISTPATKLVIFNTINSLEYKSSLGWVKLTANEPIIMGSVAGTSTTNGATLAATGILSLAPADGTNGSIVTNAPKTFGGKKTFVNRSDAKGFRATDSITTKGFRATGTATAKSFVKYGGTSSQYLMADGFITTASSIVITADRPTIQIGTQKWMKENLNTSFYRNGDPIPYVSDTTEWANLTTGAWCYYNNDPANGNLYGKLYNWYAVHDSRGLAPTGWHVPTDADWTMLTTTLGGKLVAGGKMKFVNTTRSTRPNTGANNSSGFAGLPGGFRGYDSFNDIGGSGYWWSSTELSSTLARLRILDFNVDIGGSGYWWRSTELISTLAWLRFLNFNGLSSGHFNKTAGFSVRCLRDQQGLQTAEGLIH